MPHKPTLLLPGAYVQDAAQAIRLATTRVSFLSMVVADDRASDELIDALSEAAERGVDVHVGADMYTYAELGGFFLPTQYQTRQSRVSTRMSKAFIKNGVKFTWLGRSRATIFSGRTHIKWCVVDDTVYSFGGVNLYEEGIGNNDYMLKIIDHVLAEALCVEYHRITRADAGGYSYRSHSFKHGEDTILIDGGIFGDSIIYRRACTLAARAERILIVTQYCPTGRLSRLLKKKPTEMYFNPPANASPLNKAVIKLGMFFSGHRTLYSRKQYLHAKFMIFYMPDGTRVALTGSNNFSNIGVLLGTREIALQTKNPQTVDCLEDFWRTYVA